MKALAKTWTWIGQAFVPLAIGWGVYVRGGLDGPHLEEGVLISRGYWGLLLTLAVGAALSLVAALYIRAARRAHAQILVPPNTMLEETERNTFISWITVMVFALSVVAGFIFSSCGIWIASFTRGTELRRSRPGFGQVVSRPTSSAAIARRAMRWRSGSTARTQFPA
jgi:hypothetical protein